MDNPWKSRSYTFTRSWPPRDTLRRRQSLEHIRKAHRRLQSWHRRLARAELRTKHRLWFFERPDSPNCSISAPLSNERDEDGTTSIVEPSRIDTINVPSCPKQVGLKQINHGKVIRNIMVGDMHKTFGTHQSTTIGGGHLNRSNLLVPFVVVNPLFSNMSKRAREARNKSQFIAQQ